jgi:hypothetical protein
MKWFRRHIKTGSRLALFALAIQLALSFGHFHFDAARAAPDVQIGLSDVDLSAIDGVVPAETSQPRSDHHDHDRHPSANCAACVLLSLAGNLLLSTPPVLLLPDAIELLLLVTDAEFARLNSARLPFQSRAPPLS